MLMKEDYELIQVMPENIDLVVSFISNLGSSSKKFRYFNSRDISIINNHLSTFLILFENRAVAYGHLEPDSDKTWLGIAVIEEMRGRGFGKLMLKKLLDTAKKLHLEEIHLSVDKDNEAAIDLYVKNGFKIYELKETFTLYVNKFNYD